MKKTVVGLGLMGLLCLFGGCNNPPQKTVETPPPEKIEIAEDDPQELTRLGVEWLEAGDYPRALAAFQKILSLETEEETTALAHYNSACVYSLMKDKDNAAKSLALAIKYGYEDADYMNRDKDLEYLRSFPEYQEVLKTIPPIIYEEITEKDEAAHKEAMELIEKNHGGLKFKEPPKYKVLSPEQFSRIAPRRGQGIQGFYRWTDKTLYLRNDLDPARDKGTRIHETFHALQDQLFNLGELHKQVKTTEENYLVTAVIEGDATLTFIECMPESTAARMLRIPPPWKGMMGRKPVYNREMVQSVLQLFDYSIAASFVKAIKDEQGWEGVNKIYTNLPKSTEQLLHPEKYLEGNDEPVAVSLPQLDKILGADWRVSQPNTIGEFGTLLALLPNPQSGPKAEECAKGWGGDAYVFCVNRKDKKTNFAIWKTVWDTDEDAEEFTEGGRLMIEAQFPEEVSWNIDEDNLWRFSVDGKSNAVYHKGTTVILINDIPDELFGKVLKALKE